jgi:uncharacterized protein YlxP (DUF503 family)
MPCIGVLTLELRLPESHSLKDKRHTVRGLKDRLRARFNVAVAEIAYQDTWQRALVSAVTVSGDHDRTGRTRRGRFLGRQPRGHHP